jgi:hypothetical protein
MPLSSPQALDASHVLDGFDCGKTSLNDWLLRHARQAQASGSAKTYVVAEDRRLVGYYSLTVEQIDTLGVRALLTHPLDEDAARFYLRFGFEASPVQEQ